MAQIPNVTERIAELREHKGTRILSRGEPPVARFPEKDKDAREPSSCKRRRPAERSIATSYFVTGVYALLALILASQLFIIPLLDL